MSVVELHHNVGFFLIIIINFISQHVPLQKAILHARDCLYVYVICVICFYIYTADCLLWNTDFVLLYAYSCLKCRPILCVLQSVKVDRVYKLSKFIEFTNIWNHNVGCTMDETVSCQPSSWRPGFKLRPLHVGFIVDSVLLGQVSVQVLLFPPFGIISPVLHSELSPTISGT